MFESDFQLKLCYKINDKNMTEQKRKKINFDKKFGIGVVVIFFLLIVSAFIYFVYRSQESINVDHLPLENAEDVVGKTGLHKVGGSVEVLQPAVTNYFGEVLYYKYTQESFEEVEENESETVSVIEGGKNVEKVLNRNKKVEKWVVQETGEEWSEFSLGPLSVINPYQADQQLDLKQRIYYNDNGKLAEVTDNTNYSPVIGDIRVVIEYLAVDNNLTIVGEVKDNTISAGKLFIISNK
jgi:hypothetical protein